MKKTFLTLLLSLSIFLIVGVALVFAQDAPTGPGGVAPTGPSITADIPNPFGGTTSLFALLKTIINDIILPIGGVLAVLAFIYSGFLYVTAQGNETKLAIAHRSLLYTSVGTAVLLGSWVLANVICNTIGLLDGPICPT